MTLESAQSSLDDVAASGPSSTSTSSSDVYPLPFSFGQKKIVLNDEETTVELGDHNFLTPGTNVCVSGSSDVRIGDQTKIINSDVTIYLSGPNLPDIQGGTVEQYAVECNGSVRVVSPSPTIPLAKSNAAAGIFKRHFKAIMIVLTTITVICAVTLISLRFFGNNKKPSYVPTTTTTEEAETTTKPSRIHYTFNMSQWGGRILPNKEHIEEPVQLVIIKHTKTQACQDVSNCFVAMQDLQNTDVGENHIRDIRYNFVIGGDGNIYEGRGWGVRNEQMNNSIDIAYMGDFNVDVPSEFVVGAGKVLVVKGLLNGHLDIANIRVVSHNQTEHTDSPGENLYKEIILWDYYSNYTEIIRNSP